MMWISNFLRKLREKNKFLFWKVPRDGRKIPKRKEIARKNT
jgi:hypothetical protein